MTVQTRQPQFFPKQTGNKIAKGAVVGDFQQINAGAVKTIYAKIVKNKEGVLEFDSARVLYMSNTLLGRMELHEEVEKAEEIGRVLRKKLGPVESHIQTDLLRKGNGAVEAPKAVGDLDDYIKKTDLTLSDRIDIAYQVVQGMHNMQKAGYVTGDAKLENILVFNEKGRIIARLSDFGKARELDADETSYVNGNPRFTSPEGVLSYKGEVFSTALMILRILEESLDPALCRKLKIDIPKGTSIIERRGVEGLLLRNGRKNKKGITGQLSYLGKYAIDKITTFLSLKQAQQEEKILHSHIDALCSNHFKKSYADTAENRTVLNLFGLLKDMTRADPAKRPSMQEVQWRYKMSITGAPLPIPRKRKPTTRARSHTAVATAPKPTKPRSQSASALHTTRTRSPTLMPNPPQRTRSHILIPTAPAVMRMRPHTL